MYGSFPRTRSHEILRSSSRSRHRPRRSLKSARPITSGVSQMQFSGEIGAGFLEPRERQSDGIDITWNRTTRTGFRREFMFWAFPSRFAWSECSLWWQPGQEDPKKSSPIDSDAQLVTWNNQRNWQRRFLDMCTVPNGPLRRRGRHKTKRRLYYGERASRSALKKLL